jgi:hypothetical protein
LNQGPRAEAEEDSLGPRPRDLRSGLVVKLDSSPSILRRQAISGLGQRIKVFTLFREVRCHTPLRCGSRACFGEGSRGVGGAGAPTQRPARVEYAQIVLLAAADVGVRATVARLSRGRATVQRWRLSWAARIDEMTGVQARERAAPTLPMRPGRAEWRECECVRHGTLTLIAAFDVVIGKVPCRIGPTRTDVICS